MVKKERKTTCMSTERVAAMTNSSAIDKEDVVDEAVPTNEQSHGGQMTDDHEFPKAALSNSSTSTPDSAYSELTGTPPLVQSTINKLKMFFQLKVQLILTLIC